MSARRQTQRSGFTLVEVVSSALILAIALSAAVSGLLYITRSERLNSVQNELDIDVRKAMERVRADLRLSTVDTIFYYPAGAGPYTGISFPMARDDDGDGLVEVDAEGKIIWDTQVCYHVWPVTPNQLRRTTFDPQTNGMLNDAQLQAQLDSVVAFGHGGSTYNGAAARTQAIFENLFTWRINSKGPSFDAYTPTVTLMRNVGYGSIMLSPGSHLLRFTVVGKNALSAGYKIGLDSLVMSPSGVEREGEAQTVSAQYGGAAASEYMGGGSWSGNYHLKFPAGGISNYVELTMDNDRWEETNFRGIGALCDDTEVVFDQTLAPMDFVLRIPPQTNSWDAEWQTGDPNPAVSTSGNALQGTAIRVLIRGGQQPDGGGIRYEGPLQSVRFWAGTVGNSIKILAAYIAEAASATNYTPDIGTNPCTPLFFDKGFTKVGVIPGGSETDLWVQTTFPAPYILMEKSYVISFLVDNGMYGDARFLSEQHGVIGGNPPPPGCYIIPKAVAPTEADLLAPTWSTNPVVVTDTNLYGVRSIRNLAPPVGTFESQVVDTKIAAPIYSSIAWNEIQPAGTDIKLRVRTDDNEDMSTATAWSNLVAIVSPGAISPPSKRYVQFQAELFSVSAAGVSQVPVLRDVTICWGGIPSMVDIAGTITTGPDYAIHELTVDGKKPVKGMTVDLTIYQDVRGFGGQASNRLTSTLTAEVEPRNTGK